MSIADPFEHDGVDPEDIEEPEGDEPMECLDDLVAYLETAAAVETIIAENLGIHPAASTHVARGEAFREALEQARRLAEASELE